MDTSDEQVRYDHVEEKRIDWFLIYGGKRKWVSLLHTVTLWLTRYRIRQQQRVFPQMDAVLCTSVQHTLAQTDWLWTILPHSFSEIHSTRSHFTADHVCFTELNSTHLIADQVWHIKLILSHHITDHVWYTEQYSTQSRFITGQVWYRELNPTALITDRVWQRELNWWIHEAKFHWPHYG